MIIATEVGISTIAKPVIDDCVIVHVIDLELGYMNSMFQVALDKLIVSSNVVCEYMETIFQVILDKLRVAYEIEQGYKKTVYQVSIDKLRLMSEITAHSTVYDTTINNDNTGIDITYNAFIILCHQYILWQDFALFGKAVSLNGEIDMIFNCITRYTKSA